MSEVPLYSKFRCGDLWFRDLGRGGLGSTTGALRWRVGCHRERVSIQNFLAMKFTVQHDLY